MDAEWKYKRKGSRHQSLSYGNEALHFRTKKDAVNKMISRGNILKKILKVIEIFRSQFKIKEIFEILHRIKRKKLF